MQRGDEEVERRCTIGPCPRTPLQQRPPEEERGAEEADMLKAMHHWIAQGRVEEQGNMPDPDCGAVHQRRDDGVG